MMEHLQAQQTSPLPIDEEVEMYNPEEGGSEKQQQPGFYPLVPNRRRPRDDKIPAITFYLTVE